MYVAMYLLKYIGRVESGDPNDTNDGRGRDQVAGDHFALCLE